MKICFLARPSFDVFSVALFNCLKSKFDKSLEAVFVTTNRKESSYILKHIDDACTQETSQFLKEHWNEFDLEQLKKFELKYNCAPMWKYIYTDRFLIYRSFDYAVKVTVGLFCFFEKLFSSHKIDYYYSESIATLQCYIAYLVGKKIGVKYISQMTARGIFDSKYHYFVREPYQYNLEIDENYLSNEYTNEEIKEVDALLSNFEKYDCPPTAMQKVKSEPKIDKAFLLAPLKYLKSRLSTEANDPYSYMYYKSYKGQLNPIIFYFNYLKSKKYYQSPDLNKKFVYFPLHYQPEASTLVCAEKYEKQLYFIDNLAKSLPAATLLYVKEHYALIGNRDPQFYKELKKFPNVVIISPWVNSRALIDHSIAVVALTGTAGLEAVMLRKPVFVCGNAVYENAPGVMKVNEIFGNYLNNLQKWKKPTREELIKYLCAYRRAIHPGNAYAQNFSDLISSNIDALCSSLHDYISNDLKK